jgi:hypothetical protein
MIAKVQVQKIEEREKSRSAEKECKKSRNAKARTQKREI